MKKLEDKTDMASVAKMDYYNTAHTLLEKLENDEDYTGELNDLLEYIDEHETAIIATRENNTSSAGVQNSVQMVYGIEDVPIHKTSSNTKKYATAHSRNDCQNISRGVQAGTLSDHGNSQFLSLLNTYPQNIKSGFYPNCTSHSWVIGNVVFIDVFQGISCESNVDTNRGWHGGLCDGWSTVGPLTWANVNGLYSQNNAYQIVPAIGFVK